MNDREVKVRLVPGLEKKLRELAHAMTVESVDTPSPSPIGELISLLLPDLVDDALAGGFIPGEQSEHVPRVDQVPPEEQVDIAGAVAEATARVEDLDIREPDLEVRDQPIPEAEPEPQLVFDEIAGRVHSKAVAWARGNPQREKALCLTCQNLDPSLWDWERVLPLAERTYNMQGGDDHV